MRRRIMTITISSALLALAGGVMPLAYGCSLPGINSPVRPAVVLPTEMLAGHGGSAAASSANPIVGLWHVKFFYSGALFDDAFDVWHSDGTEVLNDYTNPIEDNVCLGAWTQVGPQSYKLNHPSWTFDTSGNLTGVAIIKETVTVAQGGLEFEGTYTTSLFDTMGNPLGVYKGTLKGERMFP